MAEFTGSSLYSEFRLKSLTLPNRFVLPGMQRGWCNAGRPSDRLADYYVERVVGGTSLVISESVAVDHVSATNNALFGRLTPDTVDAWAACVGKVRAAGGAMLLQLWHEGAIRREDASAPTLSPSGLITPSKPNGRAATRRELDDIRDAFARSAQLAKQAGADGVEVHAAHGYLLDQFLWAGTNRRTDDYGGDAMRNRVRYPAEVVAAIRRACGDDFLISFRFSQWKEADFGASIAADPAELEVMLRALTHAGVDLLHSSTRRFWEPEWPGSEVTLAGWTKRLSGLPVITVGSVGLSADVMESFMGAEAASRSESSVAELEDGLAAGNFDLVSVGRSQIGDPQWVNKVRDRRFQDIRNFLSSDLGAADYDAVPIDANPSS